MKKARRKYDAKFKAQVVREKTLERMRLEIGEQVYHWHPKDTGSD